MGSIELDADNCIIDANVTQTTIDAQIGENTLTYNPNTNAVEPTYSTSAISASLTNTSLSLGDFNTVIRDTGSGQDYDYLTDTTTDVTGRYIYHGKAIDGTPTSGAAWRIFRIDTSVQPDNLTEKADGDNFTQIWDNRAALSYS